MVESHPDLENIAFIGIQTGGIYLADKIVERLKEIKTDKKIQYGKLDITFYRDDIRKELHVPNKTEIPFSIENKKVVLIDDVLFTGRTIRAAMDALQDFGRPQKVELCVLIDRKSSRQLPIQPDYCGKAIDSIISETVKVKWDREEVVLF
jgi:pyrimidine operon attenuation protein/uracil phosphoribosyltransferase